MRFSDVLVIRPGALGDTLVALPALADLNERVDVVFAGRQPGLRFLAGRVRRVIDFETSGWHHLFSDHAPDRAVPDLRPGVVAAFLNDREGAIQRNLSGRFPSASIRLFPSLPREGLAGHVARYIAECLQGAGLSVDPDRVMRRCGEGPLLGADSGPRARTKVVLHPGSGSFEKNHPIRFWTGLIKTLMREDDFRLLQTYVLLGPAEAGLRPLLEREFHGNGPHFKVQPDHDGLTAMMETAALYVGHDSGISHLAAMFGAPTVALFKTSRADRWRPLGPCVTVISSPRADAGLEKRVLGAARALLSGMGGCGVEANTVS